MKVEVWAGHSIRFVERDGEWWAVLKDVCEALGLKTFDVRRRLAEDMVSNHTLGKEVGDDMGSTHNVEEDVPKKDPLLTHNFEDDIPKRDLTSRATHEGDPISSRVISDAVITDAIGRQQEMLIVSEYGIYDTVFQSRKPEAKAFRRWVYDMLATLRRQSGLEGFEVFRMLDKEHQKAMMQRLQQGLAHPVRVDFIKANTIANKAVSNRHGRARMLKKAEMTPEMLADRERILADTVELMSVKDRFKLDISVSDAIYNKKC